MIPALSLALSHLCSTAPPSPICQLLVVLVVREGRDGGRKPSRGYRGPEGELGSYTNSSHSLPFPVLNQLEARNTHET